MNLKAQRAAALKAAQDIVAGAKASARELTSDEIVLIETKTTEIQALDVKIAEAEKGQALIEALGGLNPADSMPEAQHRAKSLGDHFISSLNGRSLKTPGTVSAPEFKAASDAQSTGSPRALTGPYGPLVTDIDRDFALPFRERLVIADLLSSGTVTGNAITYPVFGALEGGVGFVGEGAQKPQLHVADPAWITDALGEVAGFFTLTDDMAEDLEYVASEINSTAIYDLQMKEERALLSGNGTAPNLRGVLNRSGVQTATQGTDSAADAIFKAITRIGNTTDFSADGIVINPADYEKLRLAKDGNDQYYGGGYFQGLYGNGELTIFPPVWGLKTVVTSAISAGTVAVGAWKSAKVFRKGGLRVESTNSHADNFTNDKITVRVRERVGLQVKYPAAFVKLTLAE